MTEIDSIIDNLYFVYQPIANIRTGEIFGYEALIRGFDKLGFKNPHELFDYLSKNNLLFKVDIKLREKVILEFLDNFNLGHRLFYNLDSRIISDVNYKEGETIRILQNYNVPKNLLVFEVSERFSVDKASLSAIIKNYKQQGFELALDDFGVGSVCLETLYRLYPNYLKIDGFFINGINKDFTKLSIINFLNKLCSKLNIKVIAEKVEDKKIVYVLEENEIYLSQGYFIQPPSKIEQKKDYIELNLDFKRKSESENIQIKLEQFIDDCYTVSVDDNSIILYEFLNNNHHEIEKPIVVLDQKKHPIASISAKKLMKTFNNSVLKSLYFLRRDKKIYDLNDLFEPIVFIDLSKNLDFNMIENLLENSDKNYFVISENLKFKGVIHYKNLLKLVLREKLLEAIDKNPLTKLPGNISIKKYIDQNLNNQEEFFAVYFDFNNFKPFNDYYGFRRGDRSILMFSEILKSNFHSDNFFIGHVGGDDFFLGSKDIDYESLYSKVKFVVEKFNHDVISLYDRDDIEKGYIVSRDRNGVERKFEFLTFSAAIVYIPKGKKLNQSVLDEIIAQAKKEAKEQKKYIQSVCLLKTTIKEFEWTS